MKPKLTVAMCVYDSADNAADTIYNVYRQSSRVSQRVQILVRNDNPEQDAEKLEQVCDWIEADYDKNPENIGESRSRQLNLTQAQGEYIAWIDADDRVTPDYIETILREVEEHPEADIIMHQWHFIDGRLGDQHPKPLANWNVWANVYRTDLVRDVQFDPLQVYSSDYYWLEKAVKEKNPNIYYSDKSINIYNDKNENSLTRRFQRGEIKARLDEA